MVPEISATAISEGLLKVHTSQLKRFIGTASANIPCDRCNNPIEFKSRAHIQQVLSQLRRGYPRYAEGYRVICEPCWDQVQTVRHEEWFRQNDLHEQRLLELRTMPYVEYLLTPEWQERRKQHLKSAAYRCQVCNAGGVRLNVHHRTYERRDQEWFKDLITLCEGCHDLFHREGRLASD
jgi:5-methylcytosine-specific restriction endonuclease McrA